MGKRLLCPDDVYLVIFPAALIFIGMGALLSVLCYGEIISMGTFAVLMFIAIFTYIFFCLAFVYIKTSTPPAYITRHGLRVWTSGLPISCGAMDRAVLYYINKVVEVDPALTKARLYIAFSKVKIDWRKGRVARFRQGWEVVEPDGVLYYRNIRLRWADPISSSRLYHMLHHVVSDVLYGDVDAQHTRREFWECCENIRIGYSMLENNEE